MKIRESALRFFKLIQVEFQTYYIDGRKTQMSSQTALKHCYITMKNGEVTRRLGRGKYHPRFLKWHHHDPLWASKNKSLKINLHSFWTSLQGWCILGILQYQIISTKYLTGPLLYPWGREKERSKSDASVRHHHS